MKPIGETTLQVCSAKNGNRYGDKFIAKQKNRSVVC